MLEAVDLSCARGDRTLFRGLSFRVNEGELLHVTGRNGAGKTTLLRAVVGLTRPLDGYIKWNGTDTRALGDEYRAKLAYVGHLNGVQGELTAIENLRAAAALANGTGGGRLSSALERVALEAYRDFPAKILSQGQKRRLALARLLVLDRPLWILDEPLTALDTDSTELVVSQLDAHLRRGGGAIVTSHQAFDLPSRSRLNLDAG